ncbi:MAG: hypothetical protein H6818_21090 [Phycisphaerales bacterium]|nr:hypothetical protein [Phycisphaerales bacterium]MCB9862288.1 hypothetical protein [Phycisphaerales bacterium]
MPMRTLLFIIALVALLVVAYGLMRRQPRPRALTAELRRLKSYLEQDRNFCVYIGMPLNSPSRWQRAEIKNRSIHVTDRVVNLEDITSFVIAYPNGQILDSQNLFYPLPAGFDYIQQTTMPRRDVLDLSILDSGASHAKVTFGHSAVPYRERSQYSTTIQNTSDLRIRVTRFAGYVRIGDDYVLDTITGDYFSAEEFISWYAAPKDGWISPGQSVCDPVNNGSGDGYWVYFCESENGKEFAVGARLVGWPTLSKGGGATIRYRNTTRYSLGPLARASVGPSSLKKFRAT